jgi:hypothetical protein
MLDAVLHDAAFSTDGLHLTATGSRKTYTNLYKSVYLSSYGSHSQGKIVKLRQLRARSRSDLFNVTVISRLGESISACV